MRVLVCGGRDYSETDVWNWLEYNAKDMIAHALGDYSSFPIDVLIHGGAKGADKGAEKWGKSEPKCRVIEFKANWNKHGKAAGPIRNQQMLDEGKPDVVIAFPGGKGTADMIKRARFSGVEVIEVK